MSGEKEKVETITEGGENILSNAYGGGERIVLINSYREEFYRVANSDGQKVYYTVSYGGKYNNKQAFRQAKAAFEAVEEALNEREEVINDL